MPDFCSNVSRSSGGFGPIDSGFTGHHELLREGFELFPFATNLIRFFGRDLFIVVHTPRAELRFRQLKYLQRRGPLNAEEWQELRRLAIDPEVGPEVAQWLEELS